MKKLLILIMAFCLMCSMFTGCKKGVDETPVVDTPVVGTEDVETEDKTSTEENSGEDGAEVEVKESEYKSYNNTLIGINFEHDKRLFSEEHTADVMNAIAEFTKAGAKFDIHRNQIGSQLNLVTLLAKDKINTTIGVAIAPYITADDVKKAEDPVASAATDVELEAIREIVIDDAFAASMTEGLKKGLTSAKKTLIGEVTTEVVTFELPEEVVEAPAGETESGETSSETPVLKHNNKYYVNYGAIYDYSDDSYGYVDGTSTFSSDSGLFSVRDSSSLKIDSNYKLKNGQVVRNDNYEGVYAQGTPTFGDVNSKYKSNLIYGNDGGVTGVILSQSNRSGYTSSLLSSGVGSGGGNSGGYIPSHSSNSGNIPISPGGKLPNSGGGSGSSVNTPGDSTDIPDTPGNQGGNSEDSGATSSDFPYMNSEFSILLFLAFIFASSTACFTISTPYTFFAFCAKNSDIVPVPQYKSNTVSFPVRAAYSTALLYNFSVCTGFT